MKYLFAGLVILSIIVIGYIYVTSDDIRFVGGIEVEKDTTNILRASVLFELNHPGEAYVKFWKEEDEQNAFYSPLSQTNSKHDITLVGLIGDTRYKYQIIARTATGAAESEIGSFETIGTPKGMLRMVWTQKPDFPFRGYILSQRKFGRSNFGFIYILNEQGEAAWYNKVPGLPKLSTWTENNTILVLSGDAKHERSAGDQILEFNLNGNELVNLNLNTIPEPFEVHHELQYTPDGDLLVLAYDRRNIDLSASGGKADQLIVGDAIFRISKEGKIRWRWSVFDILDPAKNIHSIDSLGEWGHANTLSIDRDGNYLISFRDWNQIWKVNSTNGSLLWKLGEGGDFELPKELYFSGQHAVHINKNGEYMMYDNGVKNKRSRVLSFDIDEVKMKATAKLNIPLPPLLYSEKRGSAYFIDEKHILVCAAEVSSVALIDLKGNVVAKAHTGLPDYYRAIYFSDLYPINHVN